MATKFIQKVPHKILRHFLIITVFYSMFFSCSSLVRSNFPCVYHYSRIRVQWVKSQIIQTLPDSNYVIWQIFSSLTEASMALINPRTSYINSSMKFCLKLENASSKHLFWNTWPFQWWLIGGRKAAAFSRWVKQNLVLLIAVTGFKSANLPSWLVQTSSSPRW